MQIKKQLHPLIRDGKIKALLLPLTTLLLFLLLTGVSVLPSQNNKVHHKGPSGVALNNNKRADTVESSDTPVGHQEEDAEDKTLGWFEIDLPERVKVGKQFDMDIWLHSSDPSYSGRAKVYMERTERVQYEPRVFDLKTGERKTIKAQVTATESGLTEIRATANDWEDLSIPLDAGFSAKLRANNLPDSIDSGSIQDFSLDFVDNHGEKVRLDAPVKLTLLSSKLQMSIRGNSAWGDKVDIDIPAGSSSPPVIEVRPQVWSTSDIGTIQSVVMLDEDTVLYDQTLPPIKIKPRWWIPLLLAILGGVLFSIYQITQEFSSYTGTFRQSLFTVTIQRIAPGALAGALAYLLANYQVIGFKADTTELRGFLILGFLFAYVGIDTILKLVTTKKA
ncbi:MAG: hypothetical protein QOH51_787 [Acidobacteriota bacterium]|jgi:hypothetical protein|nr:hypothetical protein [Acidobacteriota bacterium]